MQRQSRQIIIVIVEIRPSLHQIVNVYGKTVKTSNCESATIKHLNTHTHTSQPPHPAPNKEKQRINETTNNFARLHECTFIQLSLTSHSVAYRVIFLGNPLFREKWVSI